MRAVHVAISEVPTNPDCPVVVVDVLRAFTTAAWVFERGAELLAMAATDEDALAVKAQLGPRALAIKDYPQTDGFDLGNSPGFIRQMDLRGRPVVQRTNNGTVGVHAARNAPLVLTGALVNASATANALREVGAEEVLYVITGREGTAEEDIAGAELIHALATGGAVPSDVAERVRGSRTAQRLRRRLAHGYTGYHEDDIDLACSTDVFDFTLVAQEHDDLVLLRQDRPAVPAGSASP